MSLKFILGKSGAGKTTFITESMFNDKQHNHIYIVPEQFALQSEINLSKQKNSVANIRVLSFERLAYIVIEETGNANLPVFEENAKIMLIRQIIEKNKNNMEYFKKDNICLREGIIRKISETIDEFITYDISPENLRGAIQKMSKTGGNSQICAKLGDIEKIYTEYKIFTENKFRSTEERLDILSRILEEEISPAVNSSIIWIDSFSGFTPKELSIIEHLIKITSVNIALIADDDKIHSFDPFEEQKIIMARLSEFCSKNNEILKESLWLKKNLRHKEGGELAHIEKYFPFLKINPYSGNKGEVGIFSAQNKYEEIKLTALHILDIVKNNKCRFKDIGIITADDSYKQGIEDIFSRYGIPFFSDNEMPLKIHSLSKFIISALETVIYDYRYESVFSCLKTQYAVNGINTILGEEKITWDDIYDFENYVIANGIRGSRKYGKDFEKGFIHSDFDKEKINFVRGAVFNMFSKLKPSGAKSMGKMSQNLLKFLEELDVSNTLCKMTDEKDFGMNKQVWDILMGIFETSVSIFDDKKRKPEEYFKIISAAINNIKVAFAPSASDCVIIGDLYRSRFPDTKVIFIMNANDGVFPPRRDDTGFINDYEKKKLNENSIRLSPDTNGLIQKDNFLMYLAFSKPSEKLFISYSKSTTDGEALKPALAVNRVLKLLPNLSEEKYNFEFISKEEVFDRLMKNISLCSQGKEISQEYKNIAAWFSKDKYYSGRMKKMKDGIMKINPQKILSPKAAANIFSKKNIASVSRIESFNSCPFSYFIKYTLSANQRKAYDFDFAGKGSMYHSIMEKFEKKVKDWGKITPIEIKSLIEQAVKEYIEESDNYIFEASEANKYFTSRIANTMTIAANGVVNNVRKGKFVPKLFEYKFNAGGENFNPIIINLDEDKKILLVGTIDRIDEYENEDGKYIKIIDYKSGSKSCDYDDIYIGIQLQLILYMKAYLEMYAQKNNIKPSCMFYMQFNQLASSSDPDTEIAELINKYKTAGIYVEEELISKIADPDTLKNSKSFKPEEFNILMDYVRFITEDTCREISKGNIEIKPYVKNENDNACRSCDYKSICCLEITDRQESHERQATAFTGDDAKSDFIKALSEKLSLAGKPDETE